MNYYKVALLRSPLDPLTYQSCEDIEIGTIVEVSLRGFKNLLNAVVIEKVDKPDFNCVDIQNITTKYFSSQVLEIGYFISQYYVCSFGEALSVFIPFDIDIQIVNNNEKIDTNITLSDIQNEAFDFLSKNKQALLFANTGSGKTEIYIKAIENILNQNKQALLLIPEISLSAQMEQRLKKVFKDTIAIWHSKITKKTKQKIVKELLEGKVKIIAGARSALFLPFESLGLIIVDEEHDDSYKSEQKPRLNAKDLSIYIGKKYNIQVILGSATPSLNSFYKIPYFRIKQTYFNSQKNIIFDESKLGLNELIISKIKQTLSKEQQVIVFLPTRANFKYQICSTCGKTIECPFCSVGLSLHKIKNALECHYCHYMQPIPDICPYCNNATIESQRIGTAEVVDKLKEIFPTKSIEKFDKDSIKTQKVLKKVLKDFNDTKIDILVGTQMLSKGHDYHNVTLAVVLGIDSVLAISSYRVREKALSLLIQIAGRSGRKGFGEVLIQTQNVEFFNTYLQELDYEYFLKNELKTRKDLYPPYFKLAKVIISHKNPQKAKEQMHYYIEQLKGIKDVFLVGYGEAVIFKIASKYRYEILFRSSNIKKLLEVLHYFKDNNIIVDMDTLD